MNAFSMLLEQIQQQRDTLATTPLMRTYTPREESGLRICNRVGVRVAIFCLRLAAKQEPAEV